jgi:hypothetical protein
MEITAFIHTYERLAVGWSIVSIFVVSKSSRTPGIGSARCSQL